MFNRLLFLFAAFLFSGMVSSQETDYLLQIKVYYGDGENVQFVGDYYGGFDQEPANVVLNSLALSRAPQQILLRLSFYSERGLITPNEVMVNEKTMNNSADITYTIANPAFWPAGKPLTISLFANWPALDHWIDVPIAWNGRLPAPAASRDMPADDVAGGERRTAKSPLAANAQTTTLSPGHAIQAATFSKPPGAEKLAEFEGFGSVYYIHEPPFYKLRIGTFPTKAEALRQLAAVRRYKNGAYSDAFYLYENKSRTVMTAPEAPEDVPTGYEAGSYQGVKGPGAAQASTSTPSAYDISGAIPGRVYYEQPGISIQLSTHATPPDVRAYSYLEDLGEVYVLKDGPVYRLKLGPFPSREAAEQALPQVQAAGFQYAFVKE